MEKNSLNKASICEKCENCKKRRKYKVIHPDKNGKLPTPARVLLTDSNFCVLVTESNISDTKTLLLHECLDWPCLLNQVKEAMSYLWIEKTQHRFYRNVEKPKQLRVRRNRAKRDRRKKR